MINVSREFRETIKERTDFKCYAEAALADGRQLTLTEEDFVISGNSLTDGAGANGLPLGAALCRTVKLALVNEDGRLDDCDFYGARIRLWLTFRLGETTERVELGTFTVSEPESRGETVTVTAGDDMLLADRDFDPGQGGDVTLGQLYMRVCQQCGLHYTTAVFPSSDMTVTVPAERYTCRQMLGYIAMLAGGNARVDRQGDIRILVYDRERPADHDLSGWTRLDVDTDDVVVTGLKMAAEDGDILEGAAGYVLTVENPLAAGREAETLRRMGDRLIGLRVRKFSGSHIGYPLAECMDTVTFTDRRGRRYTSVITDVTFAFGGLTSLSNSAEGVVRNGSKYVSAEARAEIEARKLVGKERTARELAVENLEKLLAESSGMYCTVEEQEDGSSVIYLHDKPQLADSANVVKITANALGMSTDGGKSYPFGFTIDGELIMGIVQAEGVNADWINTGTLNLAKMILSGTLGGIKEGYGSTKDGTTTKGLLIWGPNGLDASGNAIPPYSLLTNAGWRVQSATDANFNVSNRTGEMVGNISATGNISAGGNITATGNVGAENVDADNNIYIGKDPTVVGPTFAVYDNETGGHSLIGYNRSSSVNWIGSAKYGLVVHCSSFVTDYMPTTSSDREKKKDIQALEDAGRPAAAADSPQDGPGIDGDPGAGPSLAERYMAFMDALTPVRYRYKTEAGDAPLHIGYIWRDAEAALAAAGLARGDMAALGEVQDDTGAVARGIAYGELIPLLHLLLRRQGEQIRGLEARITALEGKGGIAT